MFGQSFPLGVPVQKLVGEVARFVHAFAFSLLYQMTGGLLIATETLVRLENVTWLYAPVGNNLITTLRNH